MVGMAKFFVPSFETPYWALLLALTKNSVL